MYIYTIFIFTSMSFRMQTCRNAPELPVGKHREICQVTQSLAEGRGLNIKTWRNRFVLGEFTSHKKSLLDKLYIPNSASNICISIVYAVLLTSHFMYVLFFFLHVCKSPQRSLTNFPHRKFHHFKSVQHQDTTKLLSQALILWTQPGLSTPMNFKPLGCLVGGY